MNALLLVATFFGAIFLVLRILYYAARKNGNGARMSALVLAAWLGTYAVALVATGLASKPTELSLGEEKCFDKWCFALKGVQTDERGQHSLQVTTLNHGRRAQRPDSPHLFLAEDGSQVEVPFAHLTDRVDGEGSLSFLVPIEVHKGVRRLDILVTEGGFPSRLAIGDENSPFHAKSTWSILAP